MIRFILNFLMNWRNYDSYYWFTHVHTSPETLEKLGGDPFKSRFDYAWKNTMTWWKHRDRYSRKCTGDCDNCKAKHC